MNERVSHHRVVPGLPRDAHTTASRSHQSVQTLSRCVSDSDEHREFYRHGLGVTLTVIRVWCRLRGTA